MSQTDGKQVTIDGVEYTVFHLQAKRSAKLLARLGGVVVPAFGIVGSIKRAAVGEVSILNAEIDGTEFSRLAAEAFARLDDALLDDVLRAFSEVTVAAPGGKLSDTFDAHFRGRMGAMIDWLAFCLRNEYADVLKKTRDGIARAGLGLNLAVSPSPSTSPKTG